MAIRQSTFTWTKQDMEHNTIPEHSPTPIQIDDFREHLCKGNWNWCIEALHADFDPESPNPMEKGLFGIFKNEDLRVEGEDLLTQLNHYAEQFGEFISSNGRKALNSLNRLLKVAPVIDEKPIPPQAADVGIYFPVFVEVIKAGAVYSIEVFKDRTGEDDLQAKKRFSKICNAVLGELEKRLHKTVHLDEKDLTYRIGKGDGTRLTEKDLKDLTGNSLDLALALSLYAGITRQEMPVDLSATAAMTESGDLSPVGHVKEKAVALAQERWFLKRVLIAANQKADDDRELPSKMDDIGLVRVKTLAEAIDEAFPGKITEEQLQWVSLFPLNRQMVLARRDVLMNSKFRYLEINEALLCPVEGMTFHEAVKRSWENGQGAWHALFSGDGGMGKTTSLIHLWEALAFSDGPLPIYLALDSLVPPLDEEDRELRWFLDQIIHQYAVPGQPESLRKELRRLFSRQKKSSKEPAVVLLLDGLNEVTDRTLRGQLIKSINSIREMNGTQVILSSRVDMAGNYTSLGVFKKLSLDGISEDDACAYLAERTGKSLTEAQALYSDIPVLANPMVLLIYCQAESTLDQIRELNAHDFEFFKEPEAKAEVIHNYMVCLLKRQGDLEGSEPFWARLFFRRLLPRIGFEMELSGLYCLSKAELDKVIREEYALYLDETFQEKYWDTIFRYMGEEDAKVLLGHPLKILEKLLLTHGRLFSQRTVDTGGRRPVHVFEFYHQDYRDYFSAYFLREELEFAIEDGNDTLLSFKERIFPLSLIKMLGGLTGEQKRRPRIQGGRYLEGCGNSTIMDDILGLFRGQAIIDGDQRLYNIMEVLKTTRVDLSDTDLSGLDLRQITLNGVRLGHGLINGCYRAAVLLEARVSWNTLCCQKHTDHVSSVSFSLDGSRLATGSQDYTIRIWNLTTGDCLLTLSGFKRWYNSYVESISFSPDGLRLVTVSMYGDVETFDARTGECLTTLSGLDNMVNSVCYSPDGMRLAVGYLHDTIILNSKTGECQKILSGHSDSVISVGYSPDGSRLATGSRDKTIKIWNATGDCLNTLSGHDDCINSLSYSPDGSRLATGSDDETIRIWNLTTGDCLQILSGFGAPVEFVSYSPDGSRLVTRNFFGTIEILDEQTGDCLNDLPGFDDLTFSVSYSPDGLRLAVGSLSNTIYILDANTGDCEKIIPGISGIMINGIDPEQFFAQSDFSDDEKALIRQYAGRR